MDLIRAQVTLQHRSALPKNAVCNNFWFATPGGADEATALAIAARVEDFYNTVVAPRPASLSAYIGNTITDGGHTIKCYEYDMATGERLSFSDAPPLTTTTWALAERGVVASDDLPSEVALCLSYSSVAGAVPGGGNFATPIARRRGRVFVGPFTRGHLVDDAADRVGRPNSTLMDALPAAAFAMAGGVANDTNPWVVYSRPYAGRAAIPRANRPDLPALPARPGTAYVIDTLAVDDAWDTQRRRGEPATARTVTAL